MSSRYMISAARRAVEDTLPTIQQLINNGQVKRSHAYIGVFDGTRQDQDVTEDELPIPIYHTTIGERADWKWNYELYARGKAAVALRACQNSGDVLQNQGQWFHTGDARHRGAVWYNGIVVAISGFAGKEDEYYAKVIAKLIELFCNEMAGASLEDFIGEGEGKPAYGTADDESDDKGLVPSYRTFLPEKVSLI